MKAELKRKLRKVRGVLAANEAEAALFGLGANFSWLSCGGEANVPIATDRSFGHFLVTDDEIFLLANRIEMPRLQAEVVNGLGATPLEYDWFDNSGLKKLKKVVNPRKVLSDCGDFGTRNRADLFHPLHHSLGTEEVTRFKSLGRVAEKAMRETCLELKPGMTEFQIAGLLSENVMAQQATAVVMLIGADERAYKFRHPKPTHKKLKRQVMVVLSARRNGLIVSTTRMVHFGAIPRELREKHDAVCVVDSAFHLNTRVGTPIREVFRRGVDTYREMGFADEWHRHHQGGPSGYQGRNLIASPTVSGVVLDNQPFAWNPTIAGTKSEDSILATKDGPVVITAPKKWPLVKVRWEDDLAWTRPDILER
ncbi:MAG: M24 family metallopeptidase [Limisphaerales bacterium]